MMFSLKTVDDLRARGKRNHKFRAIVLWQKISALCHLLLYCAQGRIVRHEHDHFFRQGTTPSSMFDFLKSMLTSCLIDRVGLASGQHRVWSINENEVDVCWLQFHQIEALEIAQKAILYSNFWRKNWNLIIENCIVHLNWNDSIGWLANFEREKNADW